MDKITNNYTVSEALLKRLQMKGLLDGQSNQTKGDNNDNNTPQSTHANDVQGSLQTLDYQALMNSTLVQNTKIQDVQFQTYKLTSAGTKILINGEEVLVKGSGEFEIAIKDNNVIIRSTKNSSSIQFKNTKDLNITVEEGAKKAFTLITGNGNDTVIVAKGAKLTTMNTGIGNDTVIVADGATVTSVNTGSGNDTVVNFGTITGSINTDIGSDAILNKGSVKLSINAGGGSDAIQNDGSVNNIYGVNGDDKIVNNGQVKGQVLGQAGTDIIIDGNKIIFEKKSIKLSDNETAVINEDGSVTVTNKDEGANKQTIVTYNKSGEEISRLEKAIQDTKQETLVEPEKIEELAFKNSANEVVCKLIGLETDKDITNAQYDAKGNLKSFSLGNTNYTVSYNSGNNITNISGRINNKLSSAVSFSYSSGRLYSRTDTTYISGVVSKQTNNVYRANGSISSETVTNYDSKGKKALSVATIFNTAGVKTTETTSTYSSNTLTQKVVKSFNVKGLIAKEETTSYAKGITSQTETKNFDTDGRLKSDTINKYNNGTIVQTITTEYNSDGTKTVKDIDRNSLIYNSEVDTTYDANEKVLSEVSITYGTVNNTANQVTAKTEKTYNSDDSVKSETVYSFENGKQTGYVVTTNNENGTKTVETYTTNANGIITLVSTQTIGSNPTPSMDDSDTTITTTAVTTIAEAKETFNNGLNNLSSEANVIKDSYKPAQNALINKGTKAAEDFKEELKNAIDSYIAKWQKDNPGKDIHEMYGSCATGPLLSGFEVEYNGQIFTVQYANKQLRQISGD